MTQRNWTQVFKTAAGAGAKTAFWTVALTVAGTAVSWGLFAALLGDLPQACASPRAEGGAQSSWCAASVGAGLLFVAVFPLIFFFIARGYGIQKGIAHIYREHRETLFVYPITKLAEYARRVVPSGEGVDSLLGVARHYVRKLNNMPFFLRIIFRRVLNKFSLVDLMEDVVRTNQIQRADMNMIAEKMTARAGSYAGADLFAPSLMFFWLALAGATGAFAGLKFLVL